MGQTTGFISSQLPIASASIPPNCAAIVTIFSQVSRNVDKVRLNISLFRLQPRIPWSLFFVVMTTLLAACSADNIPIGPTSLNSRYTEEQPTLSGSGRLLAFVSNRNGTHQLLVYDLETQEFIQLPGLNRPNTIIESPSLSYNGRYIAYITSDQGRPVVALYDRAIGRSQVVTPTYRGWLRNPHISPDGRYIVFETTIRGQWDIEVLDRGPNIELDIPNGATVGQ